jgi:hypothetical protein
MVEDPGEQFEGEKEGGDKRNRESSTTKRSGSEPSASDPAVEGKKARLDAEESEMVKTDKGEKEAAPMEEN